MPNEPPRRARSYSRRPGATTFGELIAEAYRELEAEYGPNVAVAVRSSATAEDLPTASFAGQHDSFLNIRGADALFEACRRCFASIFTDRAISYRIDNGFDHFKVALSVGVMKMVRADRASSGVAFTLDTESGFRDVVFITGVYGLGENIVQGTVDPDEFYVHKPTFRHGHRAVLSRSLGRKQMRMVYADGQSGTTNVPVPAADRERFCLDDAEVLTLADLAIKIEDHYSAECRASDADGHRMGKGCGRRAALRHPGPARDGGFAACADGVRHVFAQGPRPGAGHGPGGRREDCGRARARRHRRPCSLPAGRGSRRASRRARTGSRS